MRRLIITACIMAIAAVGMAGFGCTGGGGDIELSDALREQSTSAGAEVAVESMDTGGSSAMPTGGDTCDPRIITRTVIEVAGGDEDDVSVDPEGQTCLMSRVSDDVDFVISVDRMAQKIFGGMVEAFPDLESLGLDTNEKAIWETSMDKKRSIMDKLMEPFDQLDLEEVVGFAKFRFSEEVVNRPSDDCKKCMNECNNNSMCYKQSYDACATNPPPDGDVEKCAWNDLVFNNVYTQCSGCVDNCSDSCKSNKADPEAIGILTRWLPSENDTDGSQKMDELNTYIRDINQLIWDGKCFNTDGTPKFDENGNKMSDSIPGPDALPPEEKLVVEQVDTTVAFIHAEAAAMTPKIVEPVKICKFIRFDGLQERPAVYGEVFNMNLIMQGKAREAFTDATIDESKLVAGIDTRDQINRAYAGAINKSTNETAMFASFAINSGDNFGLELWKQMMLGFVRPDKKN